MKVLVQQLILSLPFLEEIQELKELQEQQDQRVLLEQQVQLLQ